MSRYCPRAAGAAERELEAQTAGRSTAPSVRPERPATLDTGSYFFELLVLQFAIDPVQPGSEPLERNRPRNTQNTRKGDSNRLAPPSGHLTLRACISLFVCFVIFVVQACLLGRCPGQVREQVHRVSLQAYERIRTILNDARSQAYRAINTAMVAAYWEIGRAIVEQD